MIVIFSEVEEFKRGKSGKINMKISKLEKHKNFSAKVNVFVIIIHLF